MPHVAAVAWPGPRKAKNSDPVGRLHQSARDRAARAWKHANDKQVRVEQRAMKQALKAAPKAPVPRTGLILGNPMTVNLGGYTINATNVSIEPVYYTDNTTWGGYNNYTYTPTTYNVTVNGNYFDPGTNRVYATEPPWQWVGNDVRFENGWGNWNVTLGTNQQPWNEINRPPIFEDITPEEADRRLQETRARAFKQQIERGKAVKKGRRLLLVTMTELQQRDYAKTGSFMVLAANGKWYRLRKNGTTHELGADGVATHSHCIHLSYSFIPEDTLIAVKMLLETDPAEFHRIANTSPLRDARVPRVDPAIWAEVNAAMGSARPIYALAA